MLFRNECIPFESKHTYRVRYITRPSTETLEFCAIFDLDRWCALIIAICSLQEYVNGNQAS